MLKKSKAQGFTLLEILLVVGIIAILAGIVILAINPSRQLALARNTERRSDLKQIKSAMEQYYIDYGRFPTSTPTTLSEICDTGANPYPATSSSCGSLINLSILVPTYITAIPTDPSGASSTLSLLNNLIPTAYAALGGTGYMIAKDANDNLVVEAPLAELETTIGIGNQENLVSCGPISEWSVNPLIYDSWYVAEQACSAMGHCWRLPTVSELDDGFESYYPYFPPESSGSSNLLEYFWTNEEYSATEANTGYSTNYGPNNSYVFVGPEAIPKDWADTVYYRCVR